MFLNTNILLWKHDGTDKITKIHILNIHICICMFIHAFSVSILQSPSRTLLLMSYLQSTPFFYFQPTQSLTTKAKDLLETVKSQGTCLRKWRDLSTTWPITWCNEKRTNPSTILWPPHMQFGIGVVAVMHTPTSSKFINVKKVICFINFNQYS